MGIKPCMSSLSIYWINVVHRPNTLCCLVAEPLARSYVRSLFDDNTPNKSWAKTKLVYNISKFIIILILIFIVKIINTTIQYFSAFYLVGCRSGFPPRLCRLDEFLVWP